MKYDVVIVTTASLPWRTGPSFLSLWHAVGLKDQGFHVAYIIPWLSPKCQKKLYGKIYFYNQEDQISCLQKEALRLDMSTIPEILFYPAYYFSSLRSILPTKNIFSTIPSCDTIILEEPEHLCWHPFSSSKSISSQTKVIGCVYTNYEYYISNAMPKGFQWVGVLIGKWNRSLMKKYTDMILSISPAVNLKKLYHPHEEGRITGVLAPYFKVAPVLENEKRIYFLGRLVWDKGFNMLIKISSKTGLKIDVYGDGPDEVSIKKASQKAGASLNFMGPSSSPWEEVLPKYKIFLNPSVSEVLCTATADALVAGRLVILPECPANKPFMKYENTFFYNSFEGALTMLEKAIDTQPTHPGKIRHDFEWGNACKTLANYFQ